MHTRTKREKADFSALKACAAAAVHAEMPKGAQFQSAEGPTDSFGQTDAVVAGTAGVLVNPDRSLADKVLGRNRPVQTLNEGADLHRDQIAGVVVHLTQHPSDEAQTGLLNLAGKTLVDIVDYKDIVGSGNRVVESEGTGAIIASRDHRAGLHLQDVNDERPLGERGEAVRARIRNCMATGRPDGPK